MRGPEGFERYRDVYLDRPGGPYGKWNDKQRHDPPPYRTDGCLSGCFAFVLGSVIIIGIIIWAIIAIF